MGFAYCLFTCQGHTHFFNKKKRRDPENHENGFITIVVCEINVVSFVEHRNKPFRQREISLELNVEYECDFERILLFRFWDL